MDWFPGGPRDLCRAVGRPSPAFYYGGSSGVPLVELQHSYGGRWQSNYSTALCIALHPTSEGCRARMLVAGLYLYLCCRVGSARAISLGGAA